MLISELKLICIQLTLIHELTNDEAQFVFIRLLLSYDWDLHSQLVEFLKIGKWCDLIDIFFFTQNWWIHWKNRVLFLAFATKSSEALSGMKCLKEIDGHQPGHFICFCFVLMNDQLTLFWFNANEFEVTQLENSYFRHFEKIKKRLRCWHVFCFVCLILRSKRKN